MSVAAVDQGGAPAEGVGLKRVLGTRDLVVFGVMMMFPLAPIAVYAAVSGSTAGHMAAAYLVAMVAMLFTALSYGAMAGAFPKAGSTYTFTRNGLNQYLGLLAGWAIMLDYLLFPTLNFIIIAAFAQQLAGTVGLFQGLDYWFWVIAAIVVVTIFNLVEVRWLARASAFLVVICLIVIAWFVVASIGALNSGTGEATIVSTKPFFGDGLTFNALLAGTAIACFSFLGFDAISTLAEETHNPGRSVSLAMVIALLIVTVLFVVQAYFAQLVDPNWAALPQDGSAFSVIFAIAGGNLLSTVLSYAVIAAALANAIDATGGASRLLFGMGRDGVIPRRIFGYLHPKTAAPVINVGIIAILAIFACTRDLNTILAMINFGALFAFTLVNLAVIGHFVIRGGRRSPGDLLRYLVAPGIGAFVILWLWTQLSSINWLFALQWPSDPAQLIPFIWLLIGIAYVVWTSRFFRLPLPELKETHL
ncbi:MAG: APC family permease [Candidatus Limnocylindrales bacterium]|jgi:amino acid transporter